MSQKVLNTSSRFKRLDPVSNVHERKLLTEDGYYWKGLQFPVTVKEFGAVTHIDIQPTHPHNIAVSSATRIQVYHHETSERIKTFSRFHNTVYGASYRRDGKLIIAGNEDSNARLFDTEGRVPLRIFKGHTRPVHVSKFCNNLTHVFTGGDDKTVRVWDVATEKSINKFSEHEDYIRTGAICRSSADIIATGSYDHLVKLYDTRTNSSILSVDHGLPVESILIYPSGSILLSAGGNVIKVWDILQGGKLLTSFSHHHKSITCMSFNHNCSKILSGSLDKHVKIYDVGSYNVVHNVDYPAPILSLAISNEDKTLAVGMVDKMLSIRKRKSDKTKEVDESKMSLRRKKQESLYYIRGKDYMPNEDDIVIYHKQKEQLPKYDKFFRKFQHSKALDEALQPRVMPEVTVAVFKELIRRGCLKSAMAGRTNIKLTNLLKFLIRNVTKISFTSTLLEVSDVLVDLYYPEIQDHPHSVRMLFIKLRDIVKNEAELHRQMFSLVGCLDALLATHARTENDITKLTNASDPIEISEK
ncbi:U3 small nucleolar RNA-associated protein 15 homolog [Styela clava]